MKNTLIITLIIVVVIVVAVIINKAPSLRADFKACDAELLLPGNTLVVGTCNGLHRLSGNWIKVNINGDWYACTDWRLVLKERVEE